MTHSLSFWTLHLTGKPFWLKKTVSTFLSQSGSESGQHGDYEFLIQLCELEEIVQVLRLGTTCAIVCFFLVGSHEARRLWKHAWRW